VGFADAVVQLQCLFITFISRCKIGLHHRGHVSPMVTNRGPTSILQGFSQDCS
jgi:hypothetical protein